jgi:hypothetical protein
MSVVLVLRLRVSSVLYNLGWLYGTNGILTKEKDMLRCTSCGSHLAPSCGCEADCYEDGQSPSNKCEKSGVGFGFHYPSSSCCGNCGPVPQEDPCPPNCSSVLQENKNYQETYNAYFTYAYVDWEQGHYGPIDCAQTYEEMVAVCHRLAREEFPQEAAPCPNCNGVGGSYLYGPCWTCGRGC